MVLSDGLGHHNGRKWSCGPTLGPQGLAGTFCGMGKTPQTPRVPLGRLAPGTPPPVNYPHYSSLTLPLTRAQAATFLYRAAWSNYSTVWGDQHVAMDHRTGALILTGPGKRVYATTFVHGC